VNRTTWASETGAGTPWSQGYGYTTDSSTGGFGNLNIAGDGDAPDLRCSVYDPATNQCSASGFVYDDAGNLTTYKDWTLAYDAENRQKTLVDGSTTWTYSYDGEGRRVKKTNGVTTTVYVYDAMGKLAAEYASAAPADQPDCSRCFLTVDHLGSTRLVTDAGGQVKRRTDYHPFGWEINPGYGDRNSVDGYAATDKFNPKFTGHPRDYDSGLGLDYFGARYFSAAQGRFTSADPFLGSGRAEDPQSWNRYAYGRNNPLRFVDPNGLDYYDQSGNRLGGSGDESNYVVTDEEEIKRIRKGKSVVALNTINSATLLPNPTVAGAIGLAVDRSNSSTGDDPKGGFHEEGGQWGLDASGAQVVVPAAAGAADPTITQGHVSIAIGVPANPADAGRIMTPQGGFHVHPRGQIETFSGPTSPDTIFGGTTTVDIRNFVQTPSARDLANAAYPVNIVVGARNRTVYFYYQSGTTATFPLNRLLRLR
jgi:RHS repeat-associated protein